MLQKFIPLLPQSVVRIAALIAAMAAVVGFLPETLATQGVTLPPEFLAQHAVVTAISVCKLIAALAAAAGIISHGAHAADVTVAEPPAQTPVQK